MKITERSREVLDYAQDREWFTTRDALLDIDINSGSLTRRITELREVGFAFDEQWRRRKDTGRRYKAWCLSIDRSSAPARLALLFKHQMVAA